MPGEGREPGGVHRMPDHQEQRRGGLGLSLADVVVQRGAGRRQERGARRAVRVLVLDVAVEVLQGLDLLGQVPVCGLAKQQEEIFLPERPDSIRLPRNSQGLFLVQRVRDEAHRFAITAHRAKRTKTGIASQLDEIPGVGPTRRRKLLKHFGSLEGIRAASVEDIAAVPGVPHDVAVAIKEHL